MDNTERADSVKECARIVFGRERVGCLYLAFIKIKKERSDTMTKEKLKTIDGQTLLDMDLPPIKFVVDRLIPQGLHVLSGSPKTGKSWLLLLLCLRISKGEPFWNYATEQGTTLYMCLEDSLNRIQSRLSELTEDAPDTLHFATAVSTLSDGLTNQLEEFLKEHPDTNLVVIDTFQKVRDIPSDANPYAADYKDIGMVKEIADRHNIAIIVVQHLRKQFDNDPHAMVTGSTGLIGAADTSYVLKKEKIGDDTAKLYIRGRDIEEQIFTIRFDSESKEWFFISTDTPDSDLIKNDAVLSLVVTYLQKEKEFLGTASELTDKLNLEFHTELKSSVIGKKLQKYKSQLAMQGVDYTSTRSGNKREILLIYSADDGNDGNDG